LARRSLERRTVGPIQEGSDGEAAYQPPRGRIIVVWRNGKQQFECIRKTIHGRIQGLASREIELGKRQQRNQDLRLVKIAPERTELRNVGCKPGFVKGRRSASKR